MPFTRGIGQGGANRLKCGEIARADCFRASGVPVGFDSYCTVSALMGEKGQWGMRLRSTATVVTYGMV